ncbi:MAG: hypothetical protein F4Z17_03665 [Acidimicrobiia bacterium]|nr:hypothetical protein [Acidimicrobiia bacterium]
MVDPQQSDRIANWSAWLQGPLSHEANSIRCRRDVFNSWADIHDTTNGLEGKAAMFRWWIMDNYIHTLAMAIRRLSDKNRKTRSLMSLLLDIEKHASLLTREWWERKGPLRDSRFFQYEHQEYLKEFDRISSDGHISREYVQQYINRLIGDSRAVKKFADKRIAHMDRDPDTPLSWDELHGPVDSIFEIYQHWHTEIVGVFPAEPVGQPWELIFSRSWITESQAYEIAERRKREAGYDRLNVFDSR